MEDVLASYETGAAFDEMIDSDGNVRPSYAGVYETLRRAAPDELRSIAESLANNYSQAGVTFDVGGVERPFPLDVVPRVIPADDWDIIDSGVAQRVRALEAFLADVYSDGRVITDGVIPRQLVTSSSPLPPGGLGHRAAERRPGARRRHRPDPYARGRRPGAGGQRPGAQRGLVRDDQPQRHGDRDAGGVRHPADPAGRTAIRSGCWPRCARPRRAGWTTRRWSC